MLFQERGIGVLAASADPLERAKEVVDGLRLSFPVAWGLDAEAVHAATGATINREKKFVQATAFILKPDRTIAVALYSSWAVGRLRPDEVYGTLHYLGRPSA